MKSPDEIKKALECCARDCIDPCRGCPYERTMNCVWNCKLHEDALAYIQQLEDHIRDIPKKLPKESVK